MRIPFHSSMPANTRSSLFVVLAMSTALISAGADITPVKVGTYPQEVSTMYTIEDGLPSDAVNAVAVGPNGTVFAGTDKGLAVLEDGRWATVSGSGSDAVLALAADGGTVLAATKNRLFRVKGRQAVDMIGLPSLNARALACRGDDVYIAADNGLCRVSGDSVELDTTLDTLLGSSKSVRQVALSGDGAIAVAADAGLFRRDSGGEWTQLYPNSDDGRSWAPRDVRGVAFDKDGRLWFASPQGVGCFDGDWTLYTGAEGLPYNDFTTMSRGEGGVVWFGTTIGAIRFDGQDWPYRQGRRWLPDDVVRGIAVTERGDAWFATSKGVGVIERRPMTLAEKADFYEEEAEKYIRRTEFGYLSEVALQEPGDKTSGIIYHDSDNDGLWTSMYGVGECFAYAATKDPKAKDRAKRAFEALRFLSVVTQGGEVEQQPGYVARTVVATSEPDPNTGYTLERMKRSRDTGDSLWKVYYPRWPRSADGKYWYKTDTSSDELDGHYFFYPAYYDLVAETEDEKERVCKVVRDLTDHLIRNDFNLIDHDGTPTRWSVYSPSSLNHDHMWFIERGLKSLSILSYLAVAEHMTGDPKYGEASKRLREEHAFDTNAMITKFQHGIGSGNQSDDEMAFMCYYNLIKYTKDDKLREEMTYSFFNYWVREHPEVNPFFNFAYAAVGNGVDYTDPWGTHDLSPWDGWQEDSVATLKGFPLDRLNWAHRNSHRLDIVSLPRQAASDPYDSRGRNRGHLVNGKCLPIQERFFNHWNTDPWALNYGGNGRGLASGAVYLLPYYMGLYHGFIE